MKVCHVTNYFRGTHEHVGGAEQACYRIAKLASKNGVDIAILTTKPTKEPTSEFETFSIPILDNYLDGLGKYLEVIKWYTLQFDPVSYSAFSKAMRELKPDILHFHNFQFLTLSLIHKAKELGIPTCLSIYDYWLLCPNVMLLNEKNQTCKKFHGKWCIDCLPSQFRVIQKTLLAFRRKVFDYYLKDLNAFIVLSNHSAGVLQDYGIEKERIIVVPLTLPLEYTAKPVQKEMEENLILFVGWLNLRKGVHILLEAMPYILEEVPDAKLYVIGGKVKFGEEYENRINNIMERFNLYDVVSFLGHLPPQEVEAYLQKANVVVIPEQYENMSPLIMIEAMTLARPVVASRTGGIPEFIEHGVSGLLAEQRSPKNFADNIIKILKNKEMALEMGRNARKRVLEICDNERISRKILDLYHSLQ